MLGERVLPEAQEDGKLLQVVDGAWVAVSIENSSIKTYIDDYINEALGGDY
jgi:dihydroxyacid dehydratase/phosphogluconate dehydratase